MPYTIFVYWCTAPTYAVSLEWIEKGENYGAYYFPLTDINKVINKVESRKEYAALVDKAKAEGRLDTRFAWDEDPESPLRVAARVWMRQDQAARETASRIMKELERWR